MMKCCTNKLTGEEGGHQVKSSYNDSCQLKSHYSLKNSTMMTDGL